jgi:hypothetical protein
MKIYVQLTFKTILIECPVALIRYVTYVFLKYENNVRVCTFIMVVA